MKGNRTKSRGPKSIQGRIRALHNLRNVGSKLATDKNYSEAVWKEGMNYVPETDKRTATVLNNEHERQVKKSIIKGDYNIDELREWEKAIDEGKSVDDMTIGQAKEIIKRLETSGAPPTTDNKPKPTIERPTAVRKIYGSFLGHEYTAQGGRPSRESFNEYNLIKRGSRKTYY